MPSRSAVEFAGHRRIHIGLPVSDITRSTQFYRTLLGVAPTKQRPGYAKFESDDPAVNLSLNQVADAQPTRHEALHYGIQVKSSAAVSEAATRLNQAGIAAALEQPTACCYALQQKVWAEDPDGNRWEVFVVLDNEVDISKDDSSDCCPGNDTIDCCSGNDTIDCC